MTMAAVEYGYQLLKNSPKVKRKFESLGLDLSNIEFLDAGGNGKAYAIGDGSVVVKITGDHNEAKASNILVGKTLNKVNKIYGVFKKASMGKGGDLLIVYYIIQDRLYELSEGVYSDIDEITDFLFARGPSNMSDWETYIREGLENPLDPANGNDEYFWSQYIDYYKRAYASKEFVARYLQFMVDAHKELRENGVNDFRDFHEGNVMADKQGNFKVIDLGYSNADESKIATLQEKKRVLKEYTSGEFAFGFELEGFVRGTGEGGEPTIDEYEYKRVAKEIRGEIEDSYLSENVSDDEYFDLYEEYVAKHAINKDGYFVLSDKYDEENLREDLEAGHFDQIFFTRVSNGNGKDIIEIDEVVLEEYDLDDFVSGLINSEIVIHAPTSLFDFTNGERHGWYITEVNDTYNLTNFGEAIMASDRESEYIISQELDWREGDFAELIKDTFRDDLLEKAEEYIERETKDKIMNDPDWHEEVVSYGSVVYDDPEENPKVKEIADDLDSLFDGDEVINDTISIKDDSSLEPDDERFDQAFEINSQVLKFKPSTLSKLGNWLIDIHDEYDFYVNDSCGFHTHVSWPNINPIDMLWVILGYSQDYSALSRIMSIKDKFGKRINFTDSQFADLRTVHTLSDLIEKADEEGSTEEERIEVISQYINTGKFRALNIHHQNTFEWRGPRGFINPRNVKEIMEYLKALYSFVTSINKFLMKDQIAGIRKSVFYSKVWDTEVEGGKVPNSQKPSKKDRIWKKKSKDTLLKYIHALKRVAQEAYGTTNSNGVYGVSEDQRNKINSAYKKLKGLDAKLDDHSAHYFVVSLLNNDDLDDDFKAEWIANNLGMNEMLDSSGTVIKLFNSLDLDEEEYGVFVNKIISFIGKFSTALGLNVVYGILKRFSEFDNKEMFFKALSAVLNSSFPSNSKNKMKAKIRDTITDEGIVNDKRFGELTQLENKKPILKPIPPKPEENIQESKRNVTFDDLEKFYIKNRDNFTELEDQMFHDILVAIDNDYEEVFQELRGDVADIIKEYANETWEFDLRLLLIPDILEGI